MSIGDLWQVVRRGWVWIVGGLVLGLALALLVGLLAPKAYSARASLAVSVGQAQSVNDLQQGEVFAEARARTYAAVAESSVVQERVAARVSGDGAMAPHDVNAQALPQTSIVSIEVTAADPQLARDVANGTVEELGSFARGLDGGAQSLVRLTQLSTAELPTSPSSPRLGLYGILGAVLGLSLGFLTAVGRSGRRSDSGAGLSR